MALIEFENVRKSFNSRQGQEFLAVDNFSLTIERGEFFCLLGPSGCGKTTVLGILAGFETPTTGTIFVDSQLVAGPSRDRGVVFQGDDSLYAWLTAVEHIEFRASFAWYFKEGAARDSNELSRVGRTCWPTE